MATVKRPWLWGVYVVTVGLPIILFISLMWPDKVNIYVCRQHIYKTTHILVTWWIYCCVCVFQRFGPPDQDYYYKKTDEPQAEDRQDAEELVSRAEGERRWPQLLTSTELWWPSRVCFRSSGSAGREQSRQESAEKHRRELTPRSRRSASLNSLRMMFNCHGNVTM